MAVLIETATGAGLCGGSVISRHAVLTAAHCTSNGVVSYLLIAGAYNRLQIEASQQRRRVPTANFVPHPNYGPLRLINDVAVVRVTELFTYDAFVNRIVLASDTTEAHAGSIVTVSGKIYKLKNYQKIINFLKMLD